MKLLLLIGLSLIVFVSTKELKCSLVQFNFDYFNRRLWSCYVNKQSITEPESTFLEFENQTALEAFGILNNPQVILIPERVAQAFPSLIAFQIMRCSVKLVGENHFQGLTALIHLYLGHNQIETISESAFNDNVNLEDISLGYNNLKYLSDEVFANLGKLKFLNLSFNKIRFIDPLAFQNLQNIEKINLNSNKLSVLDAQLLENLSTLKTLSVSENQLESIDETLLRNCTKLEKVWMKNNKLKTIHAKTFAGFTDLDSVDLRQNICVDRYFLSKDLLELSTTLDMKCKSETEKLIELNEKCSEEKTSKIFNLTSLLNEMEKKNAVLEKEIAVMRKTLYGE